MTVNHTLPAAVEAIEHGIDVGVHIGAQLYVSQRGEIIADLAVGEARAGVPMTPEHLVLWMSSTKPITAIAIAQQIERGKLDLDARVARYMPDFGQHGKDRITLRHLLTHTAGFRPPRFDFPQDDWQTIIAKICATPIERDWEPGEKAGYHTHTSWFILAELVQQVTGERYSDYVRSHIFEPIGMNDSHIGMPVEQYDNYGDRIAIMMNTAKGERKPFIEPAVHKAWATQARPGGNGYGPTRELARFYEMLLAGGEYNGQRIVSHDTVRLFTARHRVSLYDHTFRHTMDWGLGFMVDSKRYGRDTVPYGFGDHASQRAFGHSGSQSSTAFVDPAHSLVVALVCNGMPGEAKHQRRMRDILAAAYEDLNLA
ncbi:serine hydrolase domain-containing protein [Phycisphaerales bacterium AB-hyl4]|uniref:Serine hydrolase domain-containing protein n=1 Tax=Natronomicrosphaera hydrolytica TaxID=3242702 RepID=A0ABV4U135_9BACT